MVIAVSLQGKIWHTLIEKPVLLSFEVYNDFLLKQYFRKIRFTCPVASYHFFIIDASFLSNIIFDIRKWLYTAASLDISELHQ